MWPVETLPYLSVTETDDTIREFKVMPVAPCPENLNPQAKISDGWRSIIWWYSDLCVAANAQIIQVCIRFLLQ